MLNNIFIKPRKIVVAKTNVILGKHKHTSFTKTALTFMRRALYFNFMRKPNYFIGTTNTHKRMWSLLVKLYIGSVKGVMVVDFFKQPQSTSLVMGNYNLSGLFFLEGGFFLQKPGVSVFQKKPVYTSCYENPQNKRLGGFFNELFLRPKTTHPTTPTKKNSLRFFRPILQKLRTYNTTQTTILGEDYNHHKTHASIVVGALLLNNQEERKKSTRFSYVGMFLQKKQTNDFFFRKHLHLLLGNTGGFFYRRAALTKQQPHTHNKNQINSDHGLFHTYVYTYLQILKRKYNQPQTSVGLCVKKILYNSRLPQPYCVFTDNCNVHTKRPKNTLGFVTYNYKPFLTYFNWLVTKNVVGKKYKPQLKTIGNTTTQNNPARLFSWKRGYEGCSNNLLLHKKHGLYRSYLFVGNLVLDIPPIITTNPLNLSLLKVFGGYWYAKKHLRKGLYRGLGLEDFTYLLSPQKHLRLFAGFTKATQRYSGDLFNYFFLPKNKLGVYHTPPLTPLYVRLKNAINHPEDTNTNRRLYTCSLYKWFFGYFPEHTANKQKPITLPTRNKGGTRGVPFISPTKVQTTFTLQQRLNKLTTQDVHSVFGKIFLVNAKKIHLSMLVAKRRSRFSFVKYKLNSGFSVNSKTRFGLLKSTYKHLHMSVFLRKKYTHKCKELILGFLGKNKLNFSGVFITKKIINGLDASLLSKLNTCLLRNNKQSPTNVVVNYTKFTKFFYKNSSDVFYHFLHKVKLSYGNKQSKYRRANSFFQARMSSSLLAAVFFKNFDPIKQVLSSFFYWRSYKKHRLLIYLLKSVFQSNKSRFLGLYNFTGIKIKIKGKLSSVGGAKKRKKVWSVGPINNFTYGSQTHNHNIPFVTPTGTITMSILVN